MARNLVLSPIGSRFDISAIEAYLDAQPDIFLDPHGTGIHVVAGAPEAVPNRESARLQDPSRFPRAGYITVTPDSVAVDQEMADEDELRSIMEFLRWLWKQHEFTARDDYGQDFTEQFRTEGVETLYSEKVRRMPAPWAGKLIKVGFFQELDHGDISGPSLKTSRADTPAPDEALIVAYLESGPVLVPSSDTTEDWLADDVDVEIGPPHILTDGTYAWPADLAYYVRKYHVRLPKHFTLHIQRNGFQVPANVDLTSLTLE
jgi:hypothetical protein